MPSTQPSDIYQEAFPQIDLFEPFYLREQSTTDTNDFLTYYNDPEVYRHILAEIPKTELAAKHEILYCRELFYQQQGIYWAIAEQPSNTMIGAIGLYERDHNTLEICYDLHKDYWSKGITSVAIAKVVAFAFSKRRCDALFALTTKDNTASIHVLKKNHFRFDCTLKNSRYFAGALHDVERFVLKT